MKHIGIRTLFLSALLVAGPAFTAHAGPSLCNGAPNGIIDGNEECELGACCSAKCELLPASTVCRAGNGQCDPAETCGEQTPVSEAACPADVVVPDGGACDDGLFCTVGETCSAGTCGGGQPNTCDDDNSCTTGTCNERRDRCDQASAPNGTSCDDGDACTADDTCSGGACVGGPPPTCDDSNDCTDDACDPATGECAFVPNTAPCDDGLFCTVGDTCAAGACAGGTDSPCTDGGECETPSCDEAADSCIYTPASEGAACDDGLFCTVGETCTAGTCGGGQPNTCDDENECTADSCNEGNDSCKYTNTNNNGPCDDGLFCTENDTCKTGVCTGTALDCADDNVCTDDSCNEDSDQCDNLANTAPCDDGLYCTSNDTCSGGTCSNTTPTCSDGNVCTNDLCDEATQACSYPNNTAPCEDGLYCTVNDTCANGACGAGPARDCGDGNACTTDSCSESTDACVNANNTDPCDDGLYCTVSDACGGGTCAGSARDCGDGNLCTTDSCSESTDACVNANNTVACDDGLFCTTADACSGGACVGGPARDCGDGNVCTNDSCDEAGDECVNANNTVACDDGSFCTVGDTCSGGECEGEARDCGDGNGCTDDSCDEAGDACVNANNTDPCDDGLYCTVGDACSDGECSGSARGCDDDNECTDDACNEATDSCDAINNAASCDDGVFCNGADTCDGGECAAHAGDPCDGPGDGDGDCSETCDESADNCDGVDAEASACSDGNSCTIGDQCDDGVCIAGEIEDPICTPTTTTTILETTTTTIVVDTTTTTLDTTTTTVDTTTTTSPVDTTTTTLEPEDVCGDFNGDGELTAADALGVLRAAVGLEECGLDTCDFSGDGDITALDALATLRAAVGLPSNPSCPD